MGGLFSKPAESTSTPEPEPRSIITNDEQTAAKNKRKEEIEQRQKRREDIKKANADAEAKAAAENRVAAPAEKAEALAKVVHLANRATAQVKVLIIPANIRQLCKSCGWDVLI